MLGIGPDFFDAAVKAGHPLILEPEWGVPAETLWVNQMGWCALHKTNVLMICNSKGVLGVRREARRVQAQGHLRRVS